ncbi:MAG: glycoside hydrolase family 3 protein [Firmicutes bacterium]|nr:glycoside hydrolase family 3 protein [Bacillota bacterium]
MSCQDDKNQCISTSAGKPAYLNPDLPLDERVEDLVSRMTLEEKVSQTLNGAPGIERLGIPKYDWWNECLHGVGRAGIATVFPQAIGLAATWNDDLIFEVATAISDEARAKHHEFVRRGIREIYTGLTMWSPNVNIFRDPRWGRGQETYGEDPYLTSRVGVAFVKGLQGDDPQYFKVISTPKHFAVHSGPEADRHHFDAVVDEKDLWETYLPAFEAAVKEGNAQAIMGAYNRTNGEPCCGSKTLLQDILREKWGFDGHVVSDCWAIGDFYKHHKIVDTPVEAVAMALNNGCDLCCGSLYSFLVDAVKEGLVKEATLDGALKRLFKARFQLGMFDPPEMVSYAQIPYEVNDCEAHRELALKTARESMVLLKNDGILPLDKDIEKIAVIGPNSDNLEALLGNYNGIPSRFTTPLEAIKSKVSPKATVYHTDGCDIMGDSKRGFGAAVELASWADVAIVVMGITGRIEGEEGAGGDREEITLMGVQEDLLKAVHATGTPVILVLLSGSAVAINWAEENVPAILAAWYPGQDGGTAIADVLFGDYNPGGRLPVTFYKSLDQLPPFDDYRMGNRTYRYFKDEPLYPFGHGLSYTTFGYKDLRLAESTIQAGEDIQVQVTVENTGKCPGDEVVQLYLTDLEASVPVPLRSLQGFQRIYLAPGEKKTVSFTLTPYQMALVDYSGQRVVEPGKFLVAVGGKQPTGANGPDGEVLTAEFTVEGEKVTAEYVY